MKKRLVMRKWVEVVLGIIGWIMFLIICTECDDTLLLATTHIGAGIILLLIEMMFIKYGRDCD